MKISELIKELNVLLEERGDLNVYSSVDYGWVDGAEFIEEDASRAFRPLAHIELFEA